MSKRHKLVIELTDMGEVLKSISWLKSHIKEAIQEKEGSGRLANIQIKEYRKVQASCKNSTNETTRGPQGYGLQKLTDTLIDCTLASLMEKSRSQTGLSAKEKMLVGLMKQHQKDNALQKLTRSTQRNSRGVIRIT